MSRTSEHLNARLHIVLVAMCFALVSAVLSVHVAANPQVPPVLADHASAADDHARLQSAGDLSQAGLLVDYGNGTISWIWVPFADDEMTMMSMLEQSDLDLVTIGFGGLGNAICQVEYTGCGPSECRQRMCQTTSADPFWRVLRLDEGAWKMTSTGVDGTKVRDGDVVALSWSAKTPSLPIVSVADVATKADVNPNDQPDHAVTRTIGELPNAPESSLAWVPIAGSIGVVLAVAGGLVYRARRAS